MTNVQFDEIINLLSQPIYIDECDELYNEAAFDDYTIAYGATKLTVILDDFVLKTSLDGYATDYDDEGNQLPETEIVLFSDGSKWDQGKVAMATVEYQVYLKAVEYGVGDFFAAIEPVTESIYKQEKIECSMDSFYAIVDDVREENTAFLKEKGMTIYEFEEEDYFFARLMEVFYPKTALYLYRTFTYEELDKLLDFIDKYKINDLHDGNVGFTEDGHFKIFDFSGFISETRRLVSE